MFPERLESERLTFERLSRDTIDVSEVYSVFGSNPDAEAIFEYMDSDPHQSIKETFDWIRSAEEYFEDGEQVKYAIRPKASEEYSGEFVGVAGLYPKWDRQYAAFGIVLDKRVWGNGYSVERARVLLDVTFDHLDLGMVAVTYIDGNEKSKRAIEKYVDQYGGQYEGLLRQWLAVDGEVFDCHRYTISRSEYERVTESGK